MIQNVVIKDGKLVGYYTVTEFAKACEVDDGTVRQWIRRKKIEPLKIGIENYIPKNTPKPERKKRKDQLEREKRLFCISGKNLMCYWKVVIGRKDLDDTPLFEVAGFKNECLAQQFVEGEVVCRDDWDDERDFAKLVKVALPPFVADNDALEYKIRCLNELEAVEDA